MWKHIPPFVLVAVIFCTGLQAKSSTLSAIDKETVRMAITIFRRTPSNQQGSMVRPIILRFAQESPEVRILVSPKLMPWLQGSKAHEDAGVLLLTAYIAGSVQAQLDEGKTQDDPVAGNEQVIATYRQLQKNAPRLKISGVEKLIDLKKQGKLAKPLEAPPR